LQSPWHGLCCGLHL
jgi:integrase/recombinase XerD